MKKLALARFALAALVIVSVGPLCAQVQVYEGTLALPTYEEGPPNPNPPFDEYSATRFNYPYTLRDNVTGHRVVHTYRAVYLENKYLKCSVLPDLGGHIYTCIDKIDNVPMFYENPSIKEAQIGMRGGWAAFGAEFNFPVSHNWMTLSPVDFAFSQGKDGSGSVTVSNIDRVYGMQWSVQIVLRPGSTLLEEHVTLNNRSDVRHRFYWWSNAGIQVWDDSRICYPMQYSQAHGFADIDRWPVDSSGIDLSIIRNQTRGVVSRFVYGSREPFMGIWNPKTNAGAAHYADYAELPAKKIWSWGMDADAMDWRKALSDNGSAYVEVQAGLFRNQETYAFLDPRQTIHFTEYWMPLHDLGGLARANLAGAVNLSRAGSVLTAALNVNEKIPGATVRILDGDQVLRSATGDLVPEHPWKQQLELRNPADHYTLELRDHQGRVLLTQTEGKYDWTPSSEVETGAQKLAVVPPPAQRSEDDWLQLGRNDELNGALLTAEANYRDGLKLYPESQTLGIAYGRLSAALLHSRQAIALLSVAQSRDTPNPEIAYYLGLAYDAVDDARHARAAYETAARLPKMRAPASLRLAELDAREGDLAKSAEWLAVALRNAPGDLRAAEELAAVENALGEKDEARALAASWYAEFPTSYFLAEELGKPEVSHLGAAPFRVLNVAGEYMRLGQYPAALAVLSRDYPVVPSGQKEPGATRPQDNPLVGYYKAYCLHRLGRPSAEADTAASRLSILYVFPSGAETEEVLRSAVAQIENDATAQDLLGTLEFSVGETQEAEQRWQHAHDLHAALPGLDANRGSAFLYIDSDPSRALAAFQEGLTNDPANEAIYMGIDQALSLLQRGPGGFIEAMDHFPDKPGIPAKLVYELALHQSEAGDYPAAKSLFRDRFFPREEGGTNVRQVWIEADLEHLSTLASTGNCKEALDELSQLNQPQPGMTFTQDGMDPLIAAARVQLQVAQIDRTCQRDNAATAILKNVASRTDPEDIVWAEKAAHMLPAYDAPEWHSRLLAALQQEEPRALTHPYSMYITGLLQQQLGNQEQARADFRQVFLMPDELLSYHLTRLAQSQDATMRQDATMKQDAMLK